ncbi:hypothetical protein D3C87_1540620 [compost metagenome]
MISSFLSAHLRSAVFGGIIDIPVAPVILSLIFILIPLLRNLIGAVNMLISQRYLNILKNVQINFLSVRICVFKKT